MVKLVAELCYVSGVSGLAVPLPSDGLIDRFVCACCYTVLNILECTHLSDSNTNDTHFVCTTGYLHIAESFTQYILNVTDNNIW